MLLVSLGLCHVECVEQILVLSVACAHCAFATSHRSNNSQTILRHCFHGRVTVLQAIAHAMCIGNHGELASADRVEDLRRSATAHKVLVHNKMTGFHFVGLGMGGE